MKTLLTFITALALASTAHAVRYVTLSPSSPTVSVEPGSIVEIVGFSGVGVAKVKEFAFQLENGDTIVMPMSGLSTLASNADVAVSIASNQSALGSVYTNVNRVSLRELSDWTNCGVTIKITSAAEINAVSPGATLVLPEESTGRFNIIVESSEDLVKWNPFLSQTVNSETTSRFFRTRIVRAP